MPEVDVHALLADSTLIGISTTGLSAFRNPPHPDASDEVAVDPQYVLHTGWRDDEKGFRVALHTEIKAPIGNVKCDVQAEYELGELRMDLVPLPAMQEFVNNVAIMAVIPFVRQGIADITLRVFESALLMPMIQRGEINFALADGVPDSVET